MNEYNIMISL